MPWKLTPEQHWLAPAFLTSLYNRLGQAPEAINTAEFVLIVAVASSITLALFIPIKGRSKSPENNTIVETTKCSPTQDRREPSL
ncbi:MAG: hypothetical protein QS721_13435 [Candidatus Endonucleobacter sp. (ex Gigantidas childressi)]|nr:hypothetical protein [Candidatus Endonucleobacter sp. (ex Gigantidas childressi)]